MAGQPPKFHNCLDLDLKCELYFESCIYEDEGDYIRRKDPIPFTITGLALALDTNRQTLMNYEHKDEFFDTIKRHKTRVENYAELKLFGNNATGPIFALKNFGWKDKTERELSGPEGGPIEVKKTLFEFIEPGEQSKPSSQ